MAMNVGRAPGFASMMKDGARHFSGLEEACFRNIGMSASFSLNLPVMTLPYVDLIHRRMQRVLRDHLLRIWTEWNEQNGHQPFGKDVCHQ